ncbi:hypothetical protein [Leisingera sp. UBA4491]|jgi:hypothetical protein|uniref:hypothetical protein n=1 Tax=Leisingera sp. UBA4491 TaxID=1946748 RepID=UPI001162049A|nr:hypothetical protein [Leisingera sp. UBA4491]QDI75990.1 hypothetical protein R2C4_09615 [Leisingera aquaemixtae]
MIEYRRYGDDGHLHAATPALNRIILTQRACAARSPVDSCGSLISTMDHMAKAMRAHTPAVLMN